MTATIRFIEADGTQHEVTAEAGESVMQAAVNNSVPGVVADCGGACNCATCHGFVDPAWTNKVSPPSEDEAEMIDAGVIGAQANSRLTCQIVVSEDLDGLVIRLPETQGW